jgi:multicomponent Na+:H+ antiporter subunit D
MCASLFAIVLTNDLFNFYIFFELLAICIYILIALGGKGSTYASFNYLVLGIIASGFLVIGIGFLYFSTGYLNISKVSSLIKQQNISVLIAFFFILVGFLVKLAVFPFSFWPSLVYKYFPAGILPFYAGVISIITFYGFFLFLTKFFLKEAFDVTNFVLILCGIGVILFSFFSLFESNVKKILAYSTISQVSYAFFPLFITDAKLTAIVFLHIFLNGISKFALFVILFEILKEKQNSTINSLDGFASKSGFLSFFLLLFFANIVGLPILPMFFTKIYLILELLNIKQYIFILVILVGAVLNFIYFWRISSAIFFKKIHEEYSKPCKIMPESKISVILIFTILVLILIFFNSIINFLTISLEQFYYNV